MKDTATTEPVIYVLDPVTGVVRLVFQITNFAVLCVIITLFGIGANIANISVFIKQGFKDSINISLLGLAVSDLACLVTTFYFCIFYNFVLHNFDFPFKPLDIMYVTGGWLHICFNRITSVITAFITLERCLCIAMPLKVKNIVTPFRTKVIIISIFLSMIILFSPFYFVNKLEWKYDVSKNKSILCVTFTHDRVTVESVTYFIHGVFLSSTLLISVLISTIILVIKLNEKTKWRETSVTQATTKSETTSIKEKKVVKMITLISSIFIVCYIPTTITFLVMVFYPELSFGGRLENTLYAVWSVLVFLDVVNSSVNIFVYFNMSTKFRVTFLELFCRLSK